ncbi:four helix bundle protein [Aquiflexum gelatinilyticum]|uniref:Four helix bundle protein n=1 Tax=Aquiflexum gelatinilyticum TaxID=2961943 RepID=A0A9X2P5Q5_9BACT|nr:four helix bundle protein [Aquiflexum gelatinilyticum]MCR9014037.1 four helix bundle protein [Aquiflexum gelatinilyticum]
MGKIERFEDLGIWKKGVEIAVQVYELADKGILASDYRSRSQIIAAALSISNNIAEGFEYNSNRAFMKYLTYAKGSAGEVRSEAYVLMLTKRITKEDYDKLYPQLVELSKEIKGFIKYLSDFEKNKDPKQVKDQNPKS